MRECPNSGKDFWHLYLVRADALNRTSRYEEALNLLRADLPSGPEYAVHRIYRVIQKASAELGLEHYQAARDLLDQAEREARAARPVRPLTIGDIDFRRADLLIRNKDFDAAAKVLDELDGLGGSVADPFHVRSMRGLLLISAAKYEEAAQVCERLLADFGDRSPALLAPVRNNLSEAYYHLGNPQRALDQALKAEQVLRKEPLDKGLGNCLNVMGLSYLDLKRYPEAKRTLQESLHLARNDRERAMRLGNLVLEAVAEENWTEAANLNNQALVVQIRRGDKDGSILQVRNQALVLVGQKRYSEALRVLDGMRFDDHSNPGLRVERETLYLSIYRALGDPAAARRHFETAIGVIDHERHRLLEIDNKLSWYENQIDLNQEWVRLLVETGHAEEALDAAESSRARLMLERLGRNPAASQPPAAYREIARAQNATLISYWLAPEKSFAWVVNADDPIQVFTLPDEEEIDQRVLAWQDRLRDDDDPLRSAAGEALRDAVLGPVWPAVRNARRVILVPDGRLHSVNFESLPVDGDFWIRKATMSIAPSLKMLAGGKAQTLDPRKSRALLIGDPLPSGEFRQLKNAAQEIQTIAAAFPTRTDIYSKQRATRTAYLHAPGDPAYVHFTAHAIASAEFPLESAVILSPDPGGDRLTASDVLSKPIHAELVTISACSSAGVRAYRGEGVVGFTWAFLQSGAHGVIAGLWDVDDDATARLMTVFYKGIVRGEPPDSALRAAKLDLIDSHSHFGLPFFWAAFQYYRGAPRTDASRSGR